MALQNQPGQAQPSPQQANMMSRNAILASAKDMWLPIYTQLPAGTIAGQVINVPVRNVGLIKRFLVKITGTFVQAAAETYTLSKIGLANVLSNVQFTDLNNQQRINTSGWHLHYVASARRQAAFGAAFTNDQSTGIASNYPIMKVTSPLSTVQTFTMYYEIPISYGDYDLRGAIYANVVNATMNLQLTFNPSFQVATGTDATLAVWQSSATAVGTLAITDFKVYQNFLDQLPTTQNGPILPMLDLAHAYMLQNTALGGLVANQDNSIPFANFRQFLSTFVIYDNVGLNLGTDIGYLALQTANYTNIFKLDPYTAKVIYEREIINDDFPAGVHYFDTRRQPIITTQQGNTQLIVNPLTVTSAASQFLVGFEMLALINQVTQAGSLPAA
jgi:hypothetical protein